MKSNCLRYLSPLFVMLLITWMISCSGRPGRRVTDQRDIGLNIPEISEAALIKMSSPDENSEFKLGDPVRVVLEPVNKTRLPDSVIISFNGRRIASVRTAPWEYTIPSSLNTGTGRKSLKATAFSNGTPKTTIARFLIIMSDVVPKRYGYKVIHTYPHLLRDFFMTAVSFTKEPANQAQAYGRLN
jgi:hypothetical protein